MVTIWQEIEGKPERAYTTGLERDKKRLHMLGLKHAPHRTALYQTRKRLSGEYIGQLNRNAVVEEIKALGRRAIMVKADVANEAEAEKLIKTAIDHFGKVDVLVNNAGIGIHVMSYKMTQEQWEAVINVNLTGVLNYFRALSNI